MLVRGNTVFLFCCSKYVQHAALLYQVNMCTGEDEAWAHRKQSNGNQKDFLFQSSPIFICRGYPIISLITSHTSESIPELFCCTCMYKKSIHLAQHPSSATPHELETLQQHGRFARVKEQRAARCQQGSKRSPLHSVSRADVPCWSGGSLRREPQTEQL